jgi:hypothetical protein
MSRRIGQFSKLFGFLVSQFGLKELLGKCIQRSEGRFFHIVLALLASGALAEAGSSVTLEWDRSADTNVVGYVLYYGAIGGSALNATEFGNQTTATVTKVFEGTTNFFYVVAFNPQMDPSDPSDVVVVSLPGTYSPPSISAVGDQVIDANTAMGPISLAVEDPQWPVDSLSLRATSSNPDLVPEPYIFFGGSGSNRTVSVTPAFGQYGRTIITLIVDDGIATASTSFELTVNPVSAPTVLYLSYQAELGNLVWPMEVWTDAEASEGQYIGPSIDSLGGVTFTVDIPFLSSCLIWCRVRSADALSESFIVSVDGHREDIYDGAMDQGTNVWQWSVVNGRGGTQLPPPLGASPINPRLFPMSAGRHQISFRGQKLNAGLDEILITNDPDFVPTGIISPHALSVPPAQTINELEALVVTNAATELHNPTNTPTFSLLSAPAGATLDSHTGVLSWTPTERQGPSINFITVQLTDRGSPTFIDVGRFPVTVNEVNRAPVLTVPADLRIDELATLEIGLTATDPDSPNNNLSLSLLSAPAGMTISTNNGVLVWTPTEAQGPSTNVVIVQITDDGSPALSDISSFTVIVNEVNSAPVLARPPDRAIHQLSTLVLTNRATDADIPANTLTFSLLSAPEGVSLDPSSGVLTWTPTEAQRPSTNVITVKATDSGTPALSASTSFTVLVNEVNSAPVLSVPPNKAIHGRATLVVTNTATDPDVPADTLSFELVSAPEGVSLDPSSGVLTWTPLEAQRSSTNLLTVRVTDNGSPPLSDTGSFTVLVNEENGAPLLVVPPNQTINELSTLVVTNTAIDPDIPLDTLTFSLVSAPAGMSLDPNSGVLTWTPTEAQGPSTNLIIVQVTDNGSPPLGDTNSFTVLVNELNSPPVLHLPTDQTLNELAMLVTTITATDPDLPANSLSFSLVSGPAGVNLDANTGLLTWTPTEAQGPSTNLITVRVTDNGVPALSDTGTITVVVKEVNSAPVLPAQVTRTINELTLLTVTNTASDADLPSNLLTYQLLSAPADASISASGVISWTPGEAQGSTTNSFTTVVTDNGNPALSATNTFTVVVNEVNSAPVLPGQSTRTINELTLLTVTNKASDADLPAQVLSYRLLNPPAGASISTNGLITWTPAEEQGPSTNTIVTVVTDNGTPPLSATNNFIVLVNEVNRAPVLTVPPYKVIHGLATLVLTNSVTDPDLPANTLTFSLLAAPDGVSLDPSSGVLSWTPTEAQLSSTNLITVGVTDNGSPPLSDSGSFTVVVADDDLNNPPVLTAIADPSIDELSTLILTNTAADPDIPANTLVFDLLLAPAGMTLDPNTGVLNWTPTEAQGPSTNPIAVKVTDNGLPALSQTNHFTVLVREVNRAPVLSVPPDQTIDELSTVVVTNTATDSDIPANTLTFSLLSPPDGMIIDSHTGVLTWTPGESQGPSTNRITVQVTDNGVPALSATNSFTVVVNEINTAPVFLNPISEFRINELALLVIDNPAHDADLPANTLSWSLVSAPAGMTINSALGFVLWTPTEAQAPSTNLITIKVTDDGSPPFSATKNLTIIVDEVNSPPVLKPQPNQTINELTTLVLTNTATDADLPVNTLTFGLVSGPSGVNVDPATGVLTWTPTEAQGPSTNTVAVKVTDNGKPALSHTNSFTVFVNEVNRAPVLASISNQVAYAELQLTITNFASDSDLPANLLRFSLDSGSPAGAEINPTNGVFTWTPGTDRVQSTNLVTVRVTDNGVPKLSDARSFTIVVVSPPVIEGINASRDTVTITWSALVGITYRVQFKPSQTESTWMDLPGDVTAQGATAMKTDVIDGAAQRYYRVLVLP